MIRPISSRLRSTGVQPKFNRRSSPFWLGRSRAQSAIVDVGIESGDQGFSDTNERCADIAGRPQKQRQNVFVRRLLPHVELDAFFSFRRYHALDLPSHGDRGGMIEFGFVRICRFTNFHIFLREKLPRFGAGRSPTAVIIPVCFLAHRCLRCSFTQYFWFFEARQVENVCGPKKPCWVRIFRIAKGQTSIV